MSPDLRKTLTRLARAHLSLLARATDDPDRQSPEAVLNLGAGVVFHDVVMRLLPAPVLDVLDEGVIDQLSAEGGQISENLEHLESLRDSDPTSPDVKALAIALIERMREHLDRTERAVYLPLQRFYLESSGERGRVARELRPHKRQSR